MRAFLPRRDFWAFHEAEDLSPINSSTAWAARGGGLEGRKRRTVQKSRLRNIYTSYWAPTFSVSCKWEVTQACMQVRYRKHVSSLRDLNPSIHRYSDSILFLFDKFVPNVVRTSLPVADYGIFQYLYRYIYTVHTRLIYPATCIESSMHCTGLIYSSRDVHFHFQISWKMLFFAEMKQFWIPICRNKTAFNPRQHLFI